MNSDRAIIGAGLLALLGGCAGTLDTLAQSGAAQFGEPNRQTYAAMIIDPDPQYDEEVPTTADHAGQAVDRYRKDKVKQPVRINTASAGSGGPGS